MLPPLVKLQVKDADLLRVQDRIGDSLGAVLRNPLLDGVLLTDVVFPVSATEYAISHGLGRKPRGYLVISTPSVAIVTEDKTKRTNATMALQASDAGTFDIWVF